MLQLHKLQWGNCFSYGSPNELVLDEAKLTQLVGKNGHGKSSIALILEEVLFNKNNKSIKKADIPNRTLSGDYWIKLSFSTGGDSYLIDLLRKSSLKLKLFKNDIDISSHTATATFSTLREIIGLDFRVFSQLFYQSSTVGLQFLTATDTNRKKFLIDLFSLENYLLYNDLYKSLYREVAIERDKLAASAEIVEKWLATNKTPGPKKKLKTFEVPDNLSLVNAQNKLADIISLNRKIEDNNKLKEIIDNIEYDPELISKESIDLTKANVELGSLNSKIDHINKIIIRQQKKEFSINEELAYTSFYNNSHLSQELERSKGLLAIGKEQEKNLSSIENNCPTCTQPVAEEFKIRFQEEIKKRIEIAESKINLIQASINNNDKLNDSISRAKQQLEEYNKVQVDLNNLENEVLDLIKRQIELKEFISENEELSISITKARSKYKEWQNLYTRIDRELTAELYQSETLELEMKVLEEEFKHAKTKFDKIQEFNIEASAHNARLIVFEENQDNYKAELAGLSNKLIQFKNRAANLETLKKAFSTNGLVAYKLESLVKDLEILTNEYLVELSDGRFVLEFNLEKDKLNIIIIDNGDFINISSLSAGELARVNAATLLSIRKLMNSISKTQINILFLDEIINVLDIDGKEKLIEVLLEENLNTFLVSHEWSHPMLAKIHVIKENDISTLELS